MLNFNHIAWQILGTKLPNILGSAKSIFSSRSDHFLKTCSRVVHIGANAGQERDLYESYGLSVIWVEPIPAIYLELTRNIEPYPKQMAIQALLTDKVGDTVQFNLSSNSGASSSIFDLGLHKDIWPEVSYVDQIQLKTDTLDHLLAKDGAALPIDALILDTQGSELLVLKGSEAVLRQASFVKVEAADFEAYKGCATVSSIEAFLKQFSFRLVKKTRFAVHPSGGGYYDLVFKRRSRINRVLSGFGGISIGQATKKWARRRLGERTIGAIEYYRFPERRSEWGGPFNGQSGRAQIFKAIVKCIVPVAIVETGTYLGATTELMAATGVPLYTIEGNARNFGFAWARLRRKANVKLSQGDSRTQLRSLFVGPLKGLGGAPLFFYLDAHWNEDLPLAEEIDTIFSRSPSAVVMIDDFQVPGDPGFGYDDYGPGKALDAEYIAPLVKAHGLMVFYPSVPLREETGARRGCAVLCKAAADPGGKLQGLQLLRRA